MDRYGRGVNSTKTIDGKEKRGTDKFSVRAQLVKIFSRYTFLAAQIPLMAN